MKTISFLVTNYSLGKSSGGLSPGGLPYRKRSFLGAPKAGFIPLRGFGLRLSIARAFVVSFRVLSKKKSVSGNVLH